ncbi:helix-turn-helix transcriptional regulator [Myceligenerans pegani]|uniref:Helix-turn-helix domain-containing protein n=1 Tax=Myceligenerans pegani TaxID=2776917 RepID=A0ABR9MVL8_9MICO|nr:helix-turn-helix transcriptional regulator [Myceligenerans sp. TRM 65318]MBE1875427.1 helix-turn-helix domain-containing protein [Myceligenerans sp. TRM 65318]MBE3017698.1 helix-turn-helix domain-containing protein [Myceligenerans sp. TRM 65318]
MSTPSGLREFLTSRRAAIDPASAGLPPSTAPRRTPGLRREEVAALAGVSVDYIAKLEQGRIGNVSDQVLDAISDALRLDELERQHLRALVTPKSRRPAPPPRSSRMHARPSLRTLVDTIPNPAMVQGPRMEILASNQAMRTVLTDWDAMPRHERNIARWLFLAPEARTRYVRWETVAATTVASLRAGHDPRHPDEALERLVGELSVASPEFAAYWADYRLFKHTHGTKKFFHEAVGEFALNYDTLDIPDSGGQILCAYTPDPGSPSEEKLALLLSWAASTEPGAAPTPARHVEGHGPGPR